MATTSREQVLGRAVLGLADMLHVDIHHINSTLNPDMELIRTSHHTPIRHKEMIPQDSFYIVKFKDTKPVEGN